MRHIWLHIDVTHGHWKWYHSTERILCALSNGDISNDHEWPLTQISRSRHFWNRISEKRCVLKTKLLLHT